MRKCSPARPHQRLRRTCLLLLLPNVERIEPRFRWNLIAADVDDNKFVDTALMANADALVTHDAHFDVLSQVDFPHVRVISAEALRAALE